MARETASLRFHHQQDILSGLSPKAGNQSEDKEEQDHGLGGATSEPICIRWYPRWEGERKGAGREGGCGTRANSGRVASVRAARGPKGGTPAPWDARVWPLCWPLCVAGGPYPGTIRKQTRPKGASWISTSYIHFWEIVRLKEFLQGRSDVLPHSAGDQRAGAPNWSRNCAPTCSSASGAGFR